MQTLTVDQLVGETVKNHRIERLLGQGRLNAVYLARRLDSQRIDALTLYLVPDRFSAEARSRFLARFFKGAAAITALQHPRILPVYDYGEKEGSPYLITPYMTNGSLAGLLKKQGQFTYTQVLDILTQIAEGLTYAHNKGYVHGTLKPANIVLNDQKQMQVAGFGLLYMLQLRGTERTDNPYAHLLSIANTFLASPEYIAPEIVQGKTVDVRSDIYALGAILFELLSGKPPFSGSNPLETAKKHVEQSAPSLRKSCPDIPAALASVINQALDREPDRRFQSMSEFIEAYTQASSGATGSIARISNARPATTDQTDQAPFVQDEVQGPSTTSWQLMPPIIAGDTEAVPPPSKPQQKGPQSPGTNTDAWQLVPPIVTGGIPVIPSAKKKPVDTPPSAKAPTTEKAGGDKPFDWWSMPGEVLETPQKVKSVQQQSAPSKFDSPFADEDEVEFAGTQEPLRLTSPDVANWGGPEPIRPLPSPVQRGRAKKKRSKGPSRRQVIALLAAGGGAAVAGTAVAIYLPQILGGGKQKEAGNGGQNGAAALTTTNIPANQSVNFGDNNKNVLIHLPNATAMGTTFVAFSRACTHSGVFVNYDPNTQHLVCPAHGAVFDPANNGQVLQGPMGGGDITPLPAVQIRINNNGTITPV